MKIYNNMNRVLAILMMAVLLVVSITATAQHKQKKDKENSNAMQEFARLGKWNTQWPVQIKLHITHYVTPAVMASDSADTDMTLFYDSHSFYMQAEGMEQIANDSVLVMVNNAARMIKVYPNSGLLNYKKGNEITSFLLDTSLEKLSQRFIAGLQDESSSVRRVVLQSRDRISSADLEKEVIDVRYNAGNYQPIQYKQIRRTVVPVDSAGYSELAKDVTWKGRLITTKVKTGQLFFVVKENVTECRFTGVDYKQKISPVSEHERVVRTAGGEYVPAKGYEAYHVSLE